MWLRAFHCYPDDRPLVINNIGALDSQLSNFPLLFTNAILRLLCECRLCDWYVPWLDSIHFSALTSEMQKSVIYRGPVTV
jgi:hypothetical protein